MTRRKPTEGGVLQPSKELREMREPSLDKMLEGVDLADDRVMRFLARMARKQDEKETE